MLSRPGADVRHFIVIEGLIGVGKSSLSRLLRDAWGAQLVLEPAETNPFLEPYYADPVRFAFPVQMFYLINRWKQQDQIRQGDLFTEIVVSDYLFAKDRLFAEMTLPPTELDLYDRFAGALGEKAPTPDLLVFLDAPTDILLQRIARRHCPGEQAITREYLEDLRVRYRALLADWKDCPIVRVDNRAMNYVDDPRAREGVLNLITAALRGEPVPAAPGSDLDREAQPELFPGTEA